MVKRKFSAFFYNKQGFVLNVTTILVILSVIIAIIIFGWAIANAAQKIFG